MTISETKPEVKNTPDYGTPKAVLEAVETMQIPERVRARNRAKVDCLMNGELPYTPEQVKELQIQINVNWGEGRKTMQDANSQLNNSLLHKDGFATYTLLKGKIEKRDEWSQLVTADINRIKKRGKSGKKNLFLLKSRNASLSLHGIGPLMWPNPYQWMPRFIPLEDLLIPTGTLQDFSNLTHFAVNLYLTPYELMTMTHENSKAAEELGWNLAAVRQILNTYGKLNINPDNWQWMDRPEKMVDFWKENQAACDYDSVPKVNLAAFYYKSPEGGAENKEKWYRKIVLKDVVADNQNIATGLKIEDKFIFDSKKRVFADDIDHILHVQYGDCNLVPPHTYHATRGMGEMTFAIIECMNRLRCQWMQHIFENMMMLLRIQNPTTQDRPKVFNLKPYGVLEEGVTVVPNDERHQIDPRLVESALSENRQLLAETSSAYVQDIDNGSGKEQTLGETQIKLQSANKMIGAMLEMMFTLETFKEEEEFRRFCNKNSEDPDVVTFQAQWKAHGIPEELMKPECWQVDSDRVAGGGDQTLAQQEQSLLLANSQRFDPTAQRQILRDWTSTMTRDPAKARLLVPEQPDEVTAGRKAAESVFGTLMTGASVGLIEGVEQRDYIVSMMDSMDAIIQRIESTDKLGTPSDVVGLNTVAADIEQHLELMAQNPENKEFVTGVGKALGVQMNLVKAYAQRQAEAKPQEQDPEAMLKLQTDQMAAQQKLQNAQASFEQKMAQSEEKFAQKIRQQEETQAVSIKQMLDDARLEIESLQAKTMAEIKASQAKTQVEIDGMKKKAEEAPAPTVDK